MRHPHRASRLPRASFALAATSLAALLLAACSPGEGAENSAKPTTPPASTGFDTSEEVTLTISDGWGTTGTGELFGKILDGFEDKYPNVTIKRDTTDYDSYSQSINLKGSSPNPPDVMMLQTAGYGQGFYQFARSGLLLPLDDYADAYGWSGRFGADSNLDVFRFDADNGDQWGAGPLYGLPEQNAMITVFYNAKLMKQAGISEPPATLEAFEDSLQKAKAAGVTPIAQDNIYTHLYMAIWNAISGDGEPINDWIYGRGGSFESAESQQAAATIQDWQQAGYFQNGVSGATASDAAGLFLNGKALYYVAGSWMTGAVDGTFGADGGGFQLTGDSGTAPAGGGLTTPLTISSKTEHPDVAAAFLDYFTSEEVSDQLYTGGWGIPGALTSDSVANGTDLTSQVLSILMPIESDGGAGTTPFLDWAAPTLTEQLPAALQQLAAGKLSPAEFTAQIEGITSDFADERSGS
ncbi:extracellular solute-binding protein [Nocardioides sp. LMS-CY]|uniref:extracellular solute-binding protein n=1 Tax=Nocardioides sp. (strain LMS-CY) TaxID=2840457 RepID=UPI001C004269|nr:extracellular solute-binding protein [Nocardioides sp. LMS-CY]QWF21405.1 extracellular solute-binding protein [Nocardioides sp. LMS-CY]